MTNATENPRKRIPPPGKHQLALMIWLCVFPTLTAINLAFGDWTKVFPDPRLAKAVVDRITHKAHIIDTGSESWRFNHGLTPSKRRRGAPA